MSISAMYDIEDEALDGFKDLDIKVKDTASSNSELVIEVEPLGSQYRKWAQEMLEELCENRFNIDSEDSKKSITYILTAN